MAEKLSRREIHKEMKKIDDRLGEDDVDKIEANSLQNRYNELGRLLSLTPNPLMKMVQAYKKLEEAIMESIHFEDDICSCRDVEDTFQTIHHGNLFNEIITYCLNCGGQTETREGGF